MRKSFVKWWGGVFSIVSLLITLLFASCSGGTDYVGTSSSSGGSGDYKITISAETTTGGTVTADKENASEGDIVTLTVTPESGYELDTLSVKDADGKEVAVSRVDDAAGDVLLMEAPAASGTVTVAVVRYSFKMPKTNVTVSATFKKSETEKEPESGITTTYTVSFETNGGSAVTSQTVASGEKASEPTAPTKSGFAFLDWYADSTFTAKYDFQASVTADTTVYARWWDSTGFVLAEGSTVGEITGAGVFISGRTVTVAALWACDHEVTQKEYKDITGLTPSNFTGDNLPVEKVSWYDALVYCNKRSIAEGLTPCYTIGGKTDPAEWGTVPTSSDATWNAAICDMTANGYRLPTEAEWEYLARGGKDGVAGTQTTYAGSDTVEDVAWYTTNSGSTTHEVKGKNPISSSFKLYDMSGNVWEWCWDWYGPIAADTPAAGAASGSYRVNRGGCWGVGASYCAVSFRGSSDPFSRGSRVGFRVVRTAE